MSAYSQHGAGQIVGIVIACIGFGLCLACSVAPYWLTAKVPAEDVQSLRPNITLDPSIGNYTIHVGVWWFCIDLTEKGEICHSTYDPSDYHPWINIVRCCVVFNVILCFLGTLAACCQCMCCRGAKTLCYGLLSLFGAIFGFAVLLIFYLSSDQDTLLKVSLGDLEYDIPYMVYIGGPVLVFISSVLLCFSRENAIEKI